MNSLSGVFAAIGYIVVGAGAVGTFAWWMFRTFSEKWLNAKFEERLAAYKHEQQKELEHLKFAINAQMDRATKLHQREFEVLPEAWARLMHSHGIISSLVSRLQSTPDIDSMNPDHQKEFLDSSSLAEWQRQAVRDALPNEKTETYRKQIEPFKLARAHTASRKYYLYFRKNGIFIREPIKELFNRLDQLVLDALAEREINFQHGMREHGAADKLRGEGEVVLKELEAEVQKRLWDSAARQAG